MPVPSDILSGIVRVLDPADAVISSGKITTFNGPTAITQGTDAQRATFNAWDYDFKGQPSATFAGAQLYPLGNLSALTAAEFFAVLKLDADPAGSTSTCGLVRLSGASNNQCLYPYVDGAIYDGFASTSRYDGISGVANLAQPHIYNPRSQAGEWALNINGVQRYATATNTVSLPTAGVFGHEAWWSATYFTGKLAYAVLCDRVQTPQARAAMHAYLKARFGIVTPQDYISLLGSNLVGFWHQGQGVQRSSGTAISQWNDAVSGRAAPIIGGGAVPSYVADSGGGFFANKPVVQFASGGRYLQTAVSTIVAAGARPYVFSVHRLRDPASWADVWALNSTDDMSLYMAGSNGNVIAQFMQPGELTVTSGAQDVLPHFNEMWLDGARAHLRRDGVDFSAASTGSISPAIDRVRLANGQSNLSLFCMGVCTSLPTAEQLAQLAALIAADTERIEVLFQGTLTGYFARDARASASAWHGAFGHSMVAVSAPLYKKDGFNFGGESVPTSTATASFAESSPGDSYLYADYNGYVMVVGRFADLTSDGTLIDIDGTVGIFYDASEHAFKGTWGGDEFTIARADTEQHVFELNFEAAGSSGNVWVYLDGVLKIIAYTSVAFSDAARVSVGAALGGSQSISAKVSRVVISYEFQGDYARNRARWMLNSLDRITTTIESILGSNLREIWYSNDAELTGDEVSYLSGRRLVQSITPVSSGTRPPFRYYDPALHGTAIDCDRTGRTLRNIALSSTVLPAGGRPFVFTIGRLRTAPTPGQQRFFASVRRLSADFDLCVGTAAHGAMYGRLWNSFARHSYGPQADLNPHIAGTYLDSSWGSALWLDGVVYDAQASGAAVTTGAAIEVIAVGANTTNNEFEDWTFSVLGACANHPTTLELQALNAYFRTKYLEIEGTTHDVAVASDTAAVSDALSARLTYGRRPSDAATITDQSRVSLAYGRRPATDQPAITDQARVGAVYARRPVDAVGATDLLRASLSYGRRVQDSAAVFDKLAPMAARSMSETSIVSDALRASLTLSRQLAPDAIAAADSVQVSRAILVSLSDAIASVDVFTVNPFQYARGHSDLCIVQSSLSVARSVARRVSDAVSTVDQLSVEVSSTQNEAISVVDSLSVRLTKVVALANDAAIATDTLRVSRVLGVVANDVVSLASSEQISLAYARVANDPIEAHDELERGASAVVCSDQMSTADVVHVALARAVQVSDAMALADDLHAAQTWGRQSSDIAVVVDSQSVSRSLLVRLSDAVPVSDDMIVQRVLTRTVTHEIELSDELRVQATLHRSLSEDVFATDALARSQIVVRDVIDAIVAGDVVEPALTQLSIIRVYLFDAMSVADATARTATLPRQLSDEVELSDLLRITRALGASFYDVVDVTDETVIDALKLLHLRISGGELDATSPGPLFLSSDELGQLLLSAAPKKPSSGFAVRFGDFVTIEDSILVEI